MRRFEGLGEVMTPWLQFIRILYESPSTSVVSSRYRMALGCAGNHQRQVLCKYSRTPLYRMAKFRGFHPGQRVSWTNVWLGGNYLKIKKKENSYFKKCKVCSAWGRNSSYFCKAVNPAFFALLEHHGKWMVRLFSPPSLPSRQSIYPFLLAFFTS